MMSRVVLAGVTAMCAFLGASAAYAQRGAGDWTTSANDAQRSSWVRSDAKISPESMRKPGFELVWKVKVNNAARQLNSLTPPALIDFYIGYRGFRSLAFVGGSSDTIVGIDTDLGRIEWEKALSTGSSGSSVSCPGGMTSAVTRPTSIAYPPNLGGRGFGRGTPAKSGVGEPLQGAVTLRNTPAGPPTPPPPAAAAPARRTAPPPNPYAPRVQYVHALTSDGKFHSLYISNGEEPNPPVPFLPPNANAHGLIVFENTAYVATANGCGGAEDGVWALDLQSRKVSHWKSASSVTGTAGPAAGPDGALYAAAGGELVALESGTLKPKGSYAAGPAQFTSSPVVFEYKGKDLIAITSNDGRLHLLDTASLGVPLDKTAALSTPDFAVGALASWQDSGGERWILAPAGGAIAAWKLVERNGAPALQPGWISRDLVSPLPPMVINGVVFALSSGEFRSNDATLTAGERERRSAPAILYALDGATGRELWSSGTTIRSFVHSGGLAAGGSRVYVGSHDGTQYAFGFPIEH
jgi:outer membrane protein assembly factor BamB